MDIKKEFMQKAIGVGKESFSNGDYAIGVVIVKDNNVISTGKSKIRVNKNAILHSEIVAISEACKNLNSKFLEGCILYSTHEPCSMCASAAVWTKMKGVVFGTTIQDAKDNSTNNFSWRQIDIKCREVLNKGTPRVELAEEFMREECNKLFELTK